MTYLPRLTGAYFVTLMVQGFPVLPVIGQPYTLKGSIFQVRATPGAPCYTSNAEGARAALRVEACELTFPAVPPQVAADPSACYVIGSGTTAATAGFPQAFQIQAVDQTGQV